MQRPTEDLSQNEEGEGADTASRVSDHAQISLVDLLKLDFDQILKREEESESRIKVFLLYDSHPDVYEALSKFSRSELKRLKKNIFDIICEKENSEKIEALLSCLLPNTLLGQILYKPRYQTVSYTSGTLDKVIKELGRCFAERSMLPHGPLVMKERLEDFPALTEELRKRIPALKDTFSAQPKTTALRMCGLFVAPPPPNNQFAGLDLSKYGKSNHEVFAGQAFPSRHLTLLPGLGADF